MTSLSIAAARCGGMAGVKASIALGSLMRQLVLCYSIQNLYWKMVPRRSRFSGFIPKTEARGVFPGNTLQSRSRKVNTSKPKWDASVDIPNATLLLSSFTKLVKIHRNLWVLGKNYMVEVLQILMLTCLTWQVKRFNSYFGRSVRTTHLQTPMVSG